MYMLAYILKYRNIKNTTVVKLCACLMSVSVYVRGQIELTLAEKVAVGEVTTVESEEVLGVRV